MSEFDILKKNYKSKTLGTVQYFIGLADGLQGSEMAVQLNGLLAPAIAKAIPSNLFDDKDEVNIGDILKNADGLSKGLELLAGKLMEPANKQLRMDLLSLCQFQTKKMKSPAKVTNYMETHFQKNYGAYSFLLKEVIIHNDFLEMILSFLTNLGGNENAEDSADESKSQ